MRKIDISLNQDELKFLINSSRNVEKEYKKKIKKMLNNIKTVEIE